MMAKRYKTWMLLAFLIIIGSAYGAAPNGDYGDAPDGAQAYPGTLGKFPTLYDGSSGKIGGHTLTVGQEMIGTTVSAETDADDISDPDGIQNLVDTDLDDPVYIQIVAVAIPAPARLAFEVKIADNAPTTTRYLNVLLDFDKNGSWGGQRNGEEWVVKNQKINILPGQTEWVTTEWFNWGSGAFMPTPVWGRLTLTREPVSVTNWVGDGEFEFGEVQDFLVELKDVPPPQNKTRNVTNITKKPTCGNNKKNAGEECDGTDDKACPGKCLPNCKCPKPGKKDGRGPVEPGPKEGPCTTPIDYHALVINAGDNSRRRQGMGAADDIFNLLGQQGYDTGQYLGPYWDKTIGEMGDDGVTEGGYATLSEMEEAFRKLGEESKCVDSIMIYIVGHGLSAGGSKYGKTWSSGGIVLQGKKGSKEILTPEQLDAWISRYLPECDGQDCKTPQTSCHVSIVVESCHSGNFLGPLSKKGRTVAVSCSAKEVASFGVDSDGNSHSGDYTNGYVKDMKSPNTADTDKDGYVSVAEAHKSATDKLSVGKKSGGSQTPGFFSDECDCLPLSCAPKCPNGDIDPGEECDPEADPTGCLSYETCNDECECEAIETPQEDCGNEVIDLGEECDPTAFPTGCSIGQTCDNCECIGEGILEGCPENQYKYDDCMSRAKSYQRCVCPNEAIDCCYLQSVCNKGEYISDDCEGTCDEEEECIVSDSDIPCYICGIPEEEPDCDSDEYSSQGACEADCDGECDIDEGTMCWSCIEEEITCEDLGLYDTQKACESECDDPDICTINEGVDCWYCQHITVTCGSGLYEESDCSNACDAESGERCTPYNDYCYRCVCPDLYVSSMTGGVSKSSSTHCVTQGELRTCETTCSLSSSFSVTIKNGGTDSASASSANVEISNGVGDADVSVGALKPQQSSSFSLSSISKEATVSGESEACAELGWWKTTYTITVTADSNNGVLECNEKNNVVSDQSTPT